MNRPTLDLAVIGNCSIAALIDRRGSIVWACWPRFDGDPVFCALLDGDKPNGGFFSIEFDEEATTEQAYLRNTAIVRTEVTSGTGARFEIVDFVPRFRQYGRMYRPPMIIRRVSPLAGLCRIRVRIRPKQGYGSHTPVAITGSNHIRYAGEYVTLRLTTDAPLSHVVNESGFVLAQPMTFIIHPDETLPDAIPRTGREMHDLTRDYWNDWVRNLNVPFEWQEAVIRAAITLQLCSFAETGGIVAALTTSIPEAPNTTRNWDYRYCWIRDAFMTVLALNRVGATRTMERFIDYVTNIIAMEKGPNLKPVYAILPEDSLAETAVDSLAGYRGFAPVRVGNAAALQLQHDVYGSVVLAASQMFFDERLPKRGDASLFAMLEPLGTIALVQALTPDAGIWEYRGRSRVHTYSAAMCWAAADRLGRIAHSLGLDDRARHWRASADELREKLLERAWSRQIGAFTGSLGTTEIDASVLLLAEIGLVAADDPRFVATVDIIGKHLHRKGHLLRYSEPDDFGMPAVAFTICTFWYIDALAAIGRKEEARTIFEAVLARRNHVGLLSEDIAPETGELWGNFPQTYSMVGLIVAAMRLSTSWDKAR